MRPRRSRTRCRIYWKPFRDALVFTGVIIGLVQLCAVALIVWSNHQRNAGGANRCVMIRRSVTSVALFLFFEWTVITVTALLVSLSTIGVPWFGFSFELGFGITFVSCVIQYAIFVYHYQRRKPFRQWTLRDAFAIVMPITLVLLGSVALCIISILHYPLGEQLETVLASSIVLALFTILVPPLILYKCFIQPHQQRLMQRLRAGVDEPTDVGAASTPWEKAIRERCAEQNVQRHELHSLMLVGLGMNSLEPLRGCRGLRRLYVSHNAIDSVEPLARYCTQLECLFVDENNLATAADLVPLRRLPNLRRLAIDTNPLCLASDFEYDQIVCLLPQVTHLNGLSVTEAACKRAQLHHASWLRRVLIEYRRRVFTAQLADPALAAAWRSRRIARCQLHPARQRGMAGIVRRAAEDEFEVSASAVRLERDLRRRVPLAASLAVFLHRLGKPVERTGDRDADRDPADGRASPAHEADAEAALPIGMDETELQPLCAYPDGGASCTQTILCRRYGGRGPLRQGWFARDVLTRPARSIVHDAPPVDGALLGIGAVTEQDLLRMVSVVEELGRGDRAPQEEDAVVVVELSMPGTTSVA